MGDKKNYIKIHLSYEEQAELLIGRGLIADKEELIKRLQSVSYYRLSGYLHPYREHSNDPVTGDLIEIKDSFIPDTHLRSVWNHYSFDRRLRMLILDAIERVEVAVRSRLVYYFTEAYGPFGYLDESNFPKIPKIQDYLKLRVSLQEETARSKETYKKAFFNHYDCHRELPLWMAAELMSMGSLLTFLKGVDPSMKRKIAADFGLTDEILLSWLGALYAARNICAHHARLWNRHLGHAPKLPAPRKNPEWHEPFKINPNSTACLLFICRHWLTLISPTSKWAHRAESLLLEFPDIDISKIGLEIGWQNHPIWTQNFSKKISSQP